MLGHVGGRTLAVAPDVSGLRRRDKAILAGLYLSKFDAEGLKCLGFTSFAEAFNVIGSALGARPASVKNYRDEFDPLFPNGRRGWHGRPTREYCAAIYRAFGGLGLERFTDALKRAVYARADVDLFIEQAEGREEGDRSFARRLVTGQAAEQYFRSRYREVPAFRDHEIEDTTGLGCGFDFKVFSRARPFYAVEVKGLDGASGSIALTEKEHSAAAALRARFVLFVVKNFREEPTHQFYQDPLSSELIFRRSERRVLQISWTTSV